MRRYSPCNKTLTNLYIRNSSIFFYSSRMFGISTATVVGALKWIGTVRSQPVLATLNLHMHIRVCNVIAQPVRQIWPPTDTSF